MRVSKLVERSGVPLATIKYYIREGVLMPGETTSATQATYGEHHLRRLALIRALTDIVGLSVQKTAEVIRLIETPGDDLFLALGAAIGALPPYDDSDGDEQRDYPLARAVLERNGQVYDPDYPAVAQLERALTAASAAGFPIDDDRLDHYAAHTRAIAYYDLDHAPEGPARATIEYAVLGTALNEPVIAALRRLAHQDLALGRFSANIPAS
ncbi:MerR family transcriptional regulator [Gryllotalpicola protaetiae]|uniref:MerR family transcriptional regulator n=1 Tax=Gryllotalpicola protaetiae TaxID=2419771 RepID=A0A387BUA5_9MICO|nr:MerR family transcriptional regulator [Gryllotalpicola protaetiae]AYG04626.1 MerR family transcriptional regulator [Gryllotalpicola protaetiae]